MDEKLEPLARFLLGLMVGRSLEMAGEKVKLMNRDLKIYLQSPLEDGRILETGVIITAEELNAMSKHALQEVFFGLLDEHTSEIENPEPNGEQNVEWN